MVSNWDIPDGSELKTGHNNLYWFPIFILLCNIHVPLKRKKKTKQKKTRNLKFCRKIQTELPSISDLYYTHFSWCFEQVGNLWFPLQRVKDDKSFMKLISIITRLLKCLSTTQVSLEGPWGLEDDALCFQRCMRV